MKDRLLSTLGICRKAGKLVLGFDAVAQSAKEGKLSLIFLAADLSPKSGKEMAYVAQKQNIDIRTGPFSMDEIRHRLGKRSGIIGIADPGLAETLKQTYRMNEEDSIL